MFYLGCHLSSSGGYLAMGETAVSINANTFQYFTRNPRGGAVYHDLGNLNFSIILPRAKFDLGESFRVILDAVQSLGLDAVRSGRNDILLDGRKFSGNAFRYMRGVGLHHGTLMVDTDVDPMMRYLTVADSKLKSRAIKSVKSRVINLREAKHGLTIAELMDAVGNSFVEQYGQGRAVIKKTVDKFHGDEKLAELEALYASWEWRYGRAIDFDAQVESDRFTWGQADIRFKVTQGIIADTVIFSDALDSDFIDCIAQSLIGVPFTSRDMAERVKSLGSAKDTVGDISQTVIARDIARTLLDEAF
jgi:lipoate-protein ligase A